MRKAPLATLHYTLAKVHSSSCGAGRSDPATLISLTALARSVFIGLLGPALALTTPTTSPLIVVASIRPAVPVATSAIPFAALSLLHSPSLGRRRTKPYLEIMLFRAIIIKWIMKYY